MCRIDKGGAIFIKSIVMQILKTKTTDYRLNIKGYKNRTPINLKVLADVGLLVSGILELSPDFTGKEWIVFIGIAFKIVTKFIYEHKEQ